MYAFQGNYELFIHVRSVNVKVSTFRNDACVNGNTIMYAKLVSTLKQ
jgi:hypothetical protein